MKTKWAANFLTFTLAACLLGLLPGCGIEVGVYCDKIGECTKPSEKEYDECIDVTGDLKRNAAEKGCGADADKFLECSMNEAECRKGKVKIDGCEAAKEKLDTCLGPNPCQDYVKKFAELYSICGVGGGILGEFEGPCSSSDAEDAHCFSGCLDLLDCGCLSGQNCSAAKVESYSACIEKCS